MRSLSLRRKFVILIIGANLISAFLVFGLVQKYFYQTISSEVQKSGIAIADMMALQSTHLLLTRNDLKIQLLYSDIIEKNDRLLYAFILDENRRVVVHTFEQGFPPDLLRNIPAPHRDKKFISNLFDTENALVLDIGAPVLNWEAGAVHIGMDLSYLRAEYFSMLKKLGAIIIIVTGIATILALFFSTLMTRPLAMLSDFAEKIGRGDMDSTIELDRDDEIGKVVASLNAMKTSLKQSFALREKFEKELIEEKELLTVTLRSIGDGVIAVDMAGRISLMNKMAEKLTGWSSDDATGKSFKTIFKIIDGSNRQPLATPLDTILTTGAITDLDRNTILVAKNGSERNIDDSGAPIRNMRSEVIGAIFVFRDVTQERKIENELVKLEKLESVGILAGGIAHDFNNILTAILGNVELASHRLEPENEALVPLDRAQKATIRARDLTQQLLTFAKGGEPIKKMLSIGSVIRDSCDFTLHGSNIKCNIEITEDIHDVNVDQGQISQVIQNLIINAKQAMPEGGTINIACTNTPPSSTERIPLLPLLNYIQIKISDTGTGIPEDVLDKIFDPYFSTKETGSGLGLAITHSIIKKHRGHIFVQSSSGSGTTFTIYLPTTTQQQVAAPHPDQITKPYKHRILLMDDDESALKMYLEMLALLDCEVITTRNGTEAIEQFQQNMSNKTPFNAVILDLSIPGSSGGKDIIGEILRLDQNAKVIATSGFSSDPVMMDFREYGFSAAIAKPVQLDELNKTLTEITA